MFASVYVYVYVCVRVEMYQAVNWRAGCNLSRELALQIKMPIMAALEKLNDLIDESDPDVDMPNIVHAFQTAEEIRAKHPDQEWFHLTGLIHDLGKHQPIYTPSRSFERR